MSQLPFGIGGSVDLSFLNGVSNESAANAVLVNVVEPIALAAVKIAVFVLALALFFILVRIIVHFIKKLQSDGITVDVLNLGGGFGVHYTEEDPKYNVQEYCDYVKLLTRTLSECVERKKINKPWKWLKNITLS